MAANLIYLYKITSPTGKIYIGQTVDVEKRFNTYARGAMPFQHKLRNSILKYGWSNHKAEVVCTAIGDEANNMERLLITQYNSTTDGLNILPGGQIRKTKEMNDTHSKFMTGRVVSQTTKDKMSKIMAGKQNALGVIRTEEFKNKVSKARLGVKVSDTTNYRYPKTNLHKKVLAYSLDGDFIKEYPSIISVEMDGYSSTCVSRVCKQVRTHHKGVVFKYA